jgi:hypothetical protein
MVPWLSIGPGVGGSFFLFSFRLEQRPADITLRLRGGSSEGWRNHSTAELLDPRAFSQNPFAKWWYISFQRSSFTKPAIVVSAPISKNSMPAISAKFSKWSGVKAQLKAV